MAEERFPVRRILFALDISTLNTRIINRVVELAHRLGSELEVVFVEDETLLQLADQPLIGHLSMPGGIQTRLERQRLERDFRVAGERTRVVLETVTRRTNVRWSFRTSRSAVPREAAASAPSCDLLVIGAGSNPLGGVLQRSPAFTEVLRSSERPTLLLRPGTLFSGPALIIHDTGADTRRTVAAAARFLSPNDTVIALEPLANPMDAETFGDLTDYLRARRMSLQRRATDEPLIQAATRVQHSVSSPFVVVPEGILRAEAVEELVRNVSCQVLVIRQR
jgi:nucleotide-binding universal stress UspA family protein